MFFEWGRRSELDSSAGTPAYVSPEQASGERNLSGRSDVYSFACMVFEMLAGRPPFKGTTTMETVAQRFTSAVPDLKRYAPRVPRDVIRALVSGMALQSERRPATPIDFVRTLETAAAHRSSKAAFRNANFWIPFQWDENDLGNRGSNFLQLFGRLAPGVHSVVANG